MSQIGFTTGVRGPQPLDSTQDVQNTGSVSGANASVPPPERKNAGVSGGAFKDIPILTDPKHGGLSLEQLVQALGMEGRQLAVKNGLEAIEGKKVEIKELNDKKLEEIQKQLDNLKSKGKLDGWLKAFKWIGIALGAIASVASIAVGAALIATGAGVGAGTLLIMGGLIGCGMAVNGIVGEATGGKAGIAAGTAAICKGMGISEEAAQWIGFGVEIGVSLLGAACSLAGGVAALGGVAASGAATTATMVSKVANVVTTLGNVASGAVKVAEGGLGVASNVYDYKISRAKAELKDLEAIMLRLQESQETEKNLLESVMQRTQELLDAVTDIVKGNIEAQTAVLTGSPSMA